MTDIIVIILVSAGAFFLAVSAVGLIRLPDFYSRNHATGKSETLGAILLLVGLAIYNGWELSSVKLLIILVFVTVANPTATHAVLQAALSSGLEPWTLKTGRKAAADVEDAELGAEGGNHDMAA